MTERIINGNLQQIAAGTASYDSIQPLLDFGRGQGANFVGQPNDVYRLTNTSNGDVIQVGNRIATNYPVRRGPPKKLFMETGKNKIIWYQLFADVSGNIVGDIFLENDPIYGQGSDTVNFDTDQYIGFALAQHPVLNRVVGARLDRYAQVYRPATTADNSGYLIQTLDGAQPVQIVAGQMVLGNVGDPASFLPVGMQAETRMSGFVITHLEDQTPKTRWSFYVPPFQGFTFRENDVIVLKDKSQYRVITPFLQYAGNTGFQLMAEREVSQA